MTWEIFGTDHLKEKPVPDNAYLTFAQIAEKARELSHIPGPGGGFIGVQRDMVLVAELAHALAVFEHNVAVTLSYQSPVFNTVQGMLGHLRRPIPKETLNAST